MSAKVKSSLLSNIQTLSQQQMCEVEDFVEFLATKTRKRTAMARLLDIAPALAAAGAEGLTEDAITAEIDAVRRDRRARNAAQEFSADRS